jgi:hypothetical protein
MRSLLTRLKRLENVRAAERRPQVELQIGHYVKQLPPAYTGERHVVTVGRLADGTYHWEERPGAAPANEDDSDARTILRIIPVAVPSGLKRIPQHVIQAERIRALRPTGYRIEAPRNVARAASARKTVQ